MLIISIKYVAIVMRADNNGEGGIMALLALNLRKAKIADNKKIYMIAIGFIGASLFLVMVLLPQPFRYCRQSKACLLQLMCLTLSSCQLRSPLSSRYFWCKNMVRPLSVSFGPITMVWFLSLGLLGLHSVIQTPVVLGMFSPHWAIQFIYHHPVMTFCYGCCRFNSHRW